MIMCLDLLALDSNYFNYGMGANIGYNTYPASFSRLPGVPNCCPTFNDTYGVAYSIKGIIEYHFDNIGIFSNLALNNYSGEFTQIENQLFAVNNEPVLGSFNHFLNFSITNIAFEVGINYYFDNLLLGLSIESALPINSKFNQYESVSAPNKKIYFLDSNGNNSGKSIRNEFNGKIPDLASINLIPKINLSYDISIKADNSLILRPQLSFNYQLNNIVDNLNWKKYSFDFSVNILLNNNINATNNLNENSMTRNEEFQNQDYKKDSVKIIESKKALEQSIKDSLEAINKVNKIQLQQEIRTLDSLEKIRKEKELKLAKEREEFNQMIEEQNRVTGSQCQCFVIQFISTTDKIEFDRIKIEISKLYNGILNENIFIDPYRKIKYYRLQSKCYTNHLEAFDEKMKLIDKIDILPQILCK